MNSSIVNDQQWETTTFHNPKNAHVKSNELLKKQELLGRFKNRDEQVKHQKLDEHTDSFEVKKAELNFAQKMQKARLAQKMTQKDLAQKLNVQANFVNTYESGKAIKDPQFESKVKRILNFK